MKNPVFGDPAVSVRSAPRPGAFNRNSGVDPLPSARKEVEFLRTLYGASRTEVYFGDQATEARAKAGMPRFQILHFATLGYFAGNS